MKKTLSLGALPLLLCGLAVQAGAAEDSLQCARMVDDAARLKCYDSFTQQTAAQPAPPAIEERSYLNRSWDLDNKDDDLLGEKLSPLRPYRPSYLIARKTNQPNVLPVSPAPGHITTTSADTDSMELKFQFSQKGKILNSRSWHFLGFTSFRLWGAYTQQSSWQAFNSQDSSPFRETNYEPELIATMGTGNYYGLKLVNLGLVHQSNGRDLPGSRSWNRMYLQGGWETDTWSALVRAWWRVPESPEHDDNPDIQDYMGRGDILLRWAPLDESQVVNILLRNNLSGEQNRGFIQIDWATPITLTQSTRLHLQFTNGYGESLIDYNYRQTTLGLGVSFRDW
ncbi:MAG TPA: phospholipase A [Gallionellaceae bacterium]